jgi:hypothetical protein
MIPAKESKRMMDYRFNQPSTGCRGWGKTHPLLDVEDLTEDHCKDFADEECSDCAGEGSLEVTDIVERGMFAETIHNYEVCDCVYENQ